MMRSKDFCSASILCQICLLICLAPLTRASEGNYWTSDGELTIPRSALLAPDRPLQGLASFYDTARPIVIEGNRARVAAGHVENPEWIGWRNRSYAVLFQPPPGKITITEDAVTIIPSESQLDQQPGREVTFFAGSVHMFPGPSLKYAALWNWLRWLCLPIEKALVLFWQLTGSLGLSAMALAVMVKLLLLPVVVAQDRSQLRVAHVRQQLAPKLAEIRELYDGERAHAESMAAHKRLNVTPFYATKPALYLAIQLPFLVAIFAVLGEFSEGAGVPFLWVSDVTAPDAIAALPINIPGFGAQVSLLPIILAAVTASTPWLVRSTSVEQRRREVRSASLFGLLFLILFYPFPALLVLYWISANALQIALTSAARRNSRWQTDTPAEPRTGEDRG
jgi:YidC/Oxa1 family membrane protein insertase